MDRETWETGEAFNILMNTDEHIYRQALRLAEQDDNGDALGRWAKDLLLVQGRLVVPGFGSDCTG